MVLPITNCVSLSKFLNLSDLVFFVVRFQMNERQALTRLGESYCEREEWEKKTTKCVLRQI